MSSFPPPTTTTSYSGFMKSPQLPCVDTTEGTVVGQMVVNIGIAVHSIDMPLRCQDDPAAMTSDRLRRQIDALLDEAEFAIRAEDWQTVNQRVRSVLALEPKNADALAHAQAAERADATAHPRPTKDGAASTTQRAGSTAPPTAFANGRYVVKRFLGEGGKKKVYLAHDSLLDRDVAFALIKTEGLDAAARERVTREAQAMGRLGAHPHIVTVFDIGEEAGQPYLVLPVLGGGDVEGIIEKAPEHKLPLEQAIKIATETCLGLEFVHAKGIVHRD